MADFLNIFAALEQGDSETISCSILDRNDDIILLATVACFMRKGLTFVNGYFELTIPAYMYLSGEFENHFRMTGQRVSYWHKPNKAHWAEYNWQFVLAARNFARKTNAAVHLECCKQGSELYRTSADAR